MNVFQLFPRRAAAHVEINGGPVTGSNDPAEIGTVRYFVSIVEADGCHIGMWDGAYYDDALFEAADLKRAFGATEIIDRVGGPAR